MNSLMTLPIYHVNKKGEITNDLGTSNDSFVCTIFIKRLCTNPVVFKLRMYPEFTFLDLLIFLLHSYESKVSHVSFHDSSFLLDKSKISIDLENVNEKLINYVEDNKVLGDTSIELIEHGILIPKNDFKKTKNIVGLYKNGLDRTINIGMDDTNIDMINLSKTGSCDGFGSGPTIVVPEEDNHLKNLIFIVYKSNKPYVYNMYCLYKSMNKQERSILIPHLNKKFKVEKFIDKYFGKEEFRIVKLNDSDIFENIK